VKVFSIVCLASCVLGLAETGLAQQTVDYASVGGRVTDPSGAAVPGASVAARQTTTNVISTAETDREGRFRLPYLQVGPYEISVRLAGFREAVHSIVLTVGSAYELPIALALDTVDTSVTVSAETTPLEAARSQVASTVSQTEVANLPLNGRNFLDIALLAPGVAPANIASTQLFPETSAVPGMSLSVNSQRNLSNNFIVDGLSANDDAAGLSGITYSVEAIDQFQVVTSGGQAELGRALGGYVSVVTKSGTNMLRGSAYDFVRNDALNARNALSGTKLPMNQSQFGGSVGGPVVRDRTFYFANAELRRLDQTGLTTIAPASVLAVNTQLDRVGYRGERIATGEFPVPADSMNVFGKVEHQVNTRSRVALRYSLYDVIAENSRGAGGINAATASSHLDNRDQTAALSHLLFLSSRTVLETRAQLAHSRLLAPPSDDVGPAVNIQGVAVFGTSSTSPTARRNTMTQVVNNLSHQAGAHALRLGVDILYNDELIVYPRSIRGSYTFSSLASFLSGAYNNAGFTQTFGATEIEQGNPNVGLYVQDEWKLNSFMTMNLGLRYDLQFLETIHTDTDNVAPRIGVAISPFDSRRMVIRGNAGLFFDRVPLRALANALLSAGNTTDPQNLRQVSVSLAPAQAGAPGFPHTLAGPVPAVTLPSLTTVERDLQNAYSRQASVEVEQQIGSRSTISLGYEYLRGLRLLMSVNQNVPTCAASGVNNGCRPNPYYANNNQYSSVGDSNYHGMHVSWVQRPARWGHYRVSYTLSKSMNNVGEFFFSGPIDPTDLSKDWGRSDNDRRHRLVVNGTVQTPMTPASTAWQRVAHGFQLSTFLQAYSGAPLNITSGITTIQGTAGRPIVNGAFIPRNAAEGDAFFTLGARVSRTFRIGSRCDLETLFEGFNLTNRTNVLTRVTNFGPGAFPANPAPTFMQVASVGEPRALQFGVRARF
jgi:hypothetical protein